MIKWTELAAARGLDIPERDMARITPALDSLEAAFRPLLKKLPYYTEPAITLSETAVLAE